MRNVRRLQMTKADRGLQRYFSKEKWNWQDFFFWEGFLNWGYMEARLGRQGWAFHEQRSYRVYRGICKGTVQA
jgi:hypothetical protein